jgi:NADH-quinone oxidoreductase subunit M
MHGPQVAPIAGGAVDEPVHGDGHGVIRGPWAHLKDLDLREYLIIVPIMAAILFIGIYPQPLLSRIEPTTRNVVNCVGLENRTRVSSRLGTSSVVPAPRQCFAGETEP